ncbi:MAG TPA: glycoside hydrolase family 5 protein [Treponema sp.]|nr:glycoside hydrolase family 5 protein [Treponema sp.]
MKIYKTGLVLLLVIFFVGVMGCEKTPVKTHGRLSVEGNHLVDTHGNKVQLRGFSTQHIVKTEMYVAPRYLKELRKDFSSDVVRIAMYTHKRDYGYLLIPGLKDVVKRVVKDATKEGLYAIIDWHILADRNPLDHLEESKVFFDEMSKEFASYTNVMYELCNEPNGNDVTWKDHIKPYAEEVTKVIRKNDPKGIILVGTPRWSSKPEDAAEDPLDDPATMYTFHYYPDSTSDASRDTIARVQKQIPLFCTEFGTSECSGTGKVFPAETQRWMDFFDKQNISWCNWNLSALHESSAALQISFKLGTEMNLADRLSPSGELVRYYMRRGRVPENELIAPSYISDDIVY